MHVIARTQRTIDGNRDIVARLQFLAQAEERFHCAATAGTTHEPESKFSENTRNELAILVVTDQHAYITLPMRPRQHRQGSMEDGVYDIATRTLLTRFVDVLEVVPLQSPC